MNHSLVVRLICAWILATPLSVVCANELVVPVLGESWLIAAKTPPLQVFQGQRHDAGYRYQAATANGFNISCFVEEHPEKKIAHSDCIEHYWPKMKRNPLIDQKSVTISKAGRFVKVSYDYTSLSPKLPKHHTNYYISHNGRWIDIHISMPTALPRAEITKAFEGSLRFVPTASLYPRNKSEKSAENKSAVK